MLKRVHIMRVFFDW